MKEDELIELAKKIYQNHQDAFDFIYDNKSDRLNDILEIFKKVIENRGYNKTNRI
jgi:predicted house-cleaning noncanonical NTP pyrophosphatase (MazG superfamily)